MRRIDLIENMIETDKDVDLIDGCPGFYFKKFPSARSGGCRLQEIGAHPEEAYGICKWCWHQEVDAGNEQ